MKKVLEAVQGAFDAGEDSCLTCHSYHLKKHGAAMRCEDEQVADGWRRYRKVAKVTDPVRTRRELRERAAECEHYDGEE